MKFLFDFIPLVAFLIAFYIPEDREQGIYLAIQVLIVCSALQIILYWLWKHKIDKMYVTTFVLTVLLGGATLLLKDASFFKWKPTVVNWLFAVAFLASPYVSKKSLVEHMMGQSIKLPSIVWSRLNYSWVIFFISGGVINLYVAYHFSLEFWANFKVFGMLGITLLFVIIQMFYISRYMTDIKEGN